MNPASPAHPAPQQLHAYCLGKLPEAEMLSLHAHLESCPACAVLLTRVREDTFLEKLRHGGAGDGTRPQDARPQDASTPEMAGVFGPDCDCVMGVRVQSWRKALPAAV